MTVADVNTLRAFSQLQRGPIVEYLKSRLGELDGNLRHVDSDKFKVLQGRAQEIEDILELIENADNEIKEARAKHEPRISMNKAF